ncbi:MAG: type II toxin-antitoxin system prevent-host-death family antitoxin [Vicinamibacterales bacterium]
MTMIVVNIHQAKAKLSEYLDAVAQGERVLICKRNQPVAELRAVADVRTAPRPIGGAKARFEVPPSFFEPLPDEAIDAFYGEQAGGFGAAKVAEKTGAAPLARRSADKRRR